VALQENMLSHLNYHNKYHIMVCQTTTMLRLGAEQPALDQV
jgi:hypothetical protein